MDKKEWIRRIHQTQSELSDLRWDYWRQHVWLSWQWVLLMVLALLSVFFFVRTVDRSRLCEITLFGFSLFSFIVFLDCFGSDLGIWDYPQMVLPWGSRLICADIIMSVIYTYLFQQLRHWKPYTIAMLILGFIFAFILEPLAIWAEVYKPYSWHIVYSFPVYIALGLVFRFCVLFLINQQKNARLGS